MKGGVTAPRGLMAAGISCGIKKNDKKDLALIYSEVIAAAAAVFTTNRVKAAPLVLSAEHIANGQAQAVLVNSGCANAATGTKGRQDAGEMAKLTAEALGIKKEDVLVASTGTIGTFLPMEKIGSGIKEVKDKLSKAAGRDAAQAIMTTDTFPKEATVTLEIGKKKVVIGGIAKGAGMIAPDLATMLAFITTDVAISSKLLKKALKTSTAKSFNMITVDGEESTNDLVVLLANGLAGNKKIDSEDEDFKKFSSALDEVTLTLAKMMIRDAEGASKFVEITVKNALALEDAKRVAFSIANSLLVKTALFGEDANWGRIMAAVGNSGVEIKEEKIDIYLGSLPLVSSGCALQFSEPAAKEILTAKEIEIVVDLNLGTKTAKVWTSDLTPEYIEINAHYRT
jgi:glutamate N-acetyltransferase/amino-acid N-acetyltransferase